MKGEPSISRIAAGIIVLLAFGAHSTVEAAVGRTAGAYAVSLTGAATYSIPIWAPRGPNGLQPAISLSYNSQSGNGFLGVGWSVLGLSSIYRCGQTYAQNAGAGPVSLTSTDVFCMDGQQLRLTGGSYGAPGSTYQTEVANFANVTAYSSAGNGPAYFEVQAKDGATYEYGNGAGSQVLATGTSTPWMWYLDKVTDRAGNTMTISYNTSNGTAVPNTISWTPSSYGAVTYNYTMVFTYGTNASQSSTYGYVAGTPFSNTNLLTAISVNYTGTTVKKYVLSYQQSPTTGRDELTQVQECADAAQTNCLFPTTIAYQSGGAGVSGTTSTLSLGGTPQWYLAGYDVNGDGYKDLIYQIGGTWYVAFGSASGYGAPISTGITTPAYNVGKGQLLVGDLLGTGKDGLLANNGGTWYYWTWNGSSFSAVSTGLAYDSTATAFALADTNGDGLPDLVSLYLNTLGVEAAVYIKLNASSGGKPAWGLLYTAYTNNDNSQDATTNGGLRDADAQHAVPIQKVDFDGDGRDDLVLHLTWYDAADKIHYSAAYYLLSHGTYFSAVSAPYAASAAYFVNWNDDGCTDYLVGASLNLSECTGTSFSTITLPVTPVAAIDWDGGGRRGILYQSGGTLYAAPSTGQGLGSGTSTGISYNPSATYSGADITGDGLDDLVTWVLGGSTVTYNLHNAGGQPPDLLSSLKDGYENSAQPAYSSIAQGAYGEGTDATYPYANYIGPLYVVNQTTFSDPSSSSGATYQQLFNYYKGWMNLQGRGFAGFEEKRTYDSRTGVYDYWYYNVAFPYNGMPTAEYYNFPSVTTRYIQNTLAVNELDSSANNERYFPYISKTTTQRKELGGTENGEQIDTVSTSYTFDNYGNATKIATTLTDNDPGSPYVGDTWTTTTTNTPDVDTSTWCTGLLSESQVSYTASDGSNAVTRTRSYTPDLSMCRYTQIVTEPSSSTYEVAEGLGYDSFGNVNSDSVTGIGMTARQKAANWGATGQFPMSMTDATNATTTFNYDFRYGLVSSETDPNSLKTSWQYGDGFGRLTQATRPDGTYTTFSYNDCVNWAGCPITSHTLAFSHTVHNTDGSTESVGTVWEDAAERPVLSNESMLASNTYDRNEVRYDSLGRLAQRAFPCAWSAVSTPCPYWMTFSYDGLNRLTAAARPISQSDSTLATTAYAYGGDATTITDANGHAKTLIRDTNGWLRRTEDAMGYTIILGYDAAGGHTGTTDNQGNTLWSGTIQYGIAPFTTVAADADLGTWHYAFDALGELTAWSDAKGQSFSTRYDALSRITDRYEPDLYSHWTWGSSAAAHEIGRLHSVCTGTGSNPTACTSASGYAESETYDSDGRQYQRSIAIPGDTTYTYTMTYNATTGLLDTLTYPASSSGYHLQIKYGYGNGLVQSITDVSDSPSVTLWTGNAADALDQYTQETFGNGIVVNHDFDSVTGLVDKITAGPSGSATLQNNSYLYDGVGNLIQRQDNNAGTTESVYYDSLNRLDHTVGDTSTQMTYDPLGRIATWEAYGNSTNRNDYTTAQAACTYYGNAQLHALRESTQGSWPPSSFCYDANGNFTARISSGTMGTSVTWTSFNQPSKVTAPTSNSSSQFFYDENHQRYEQIASYSGATESTEYIGGLLERMSNSSGISYRYYIPAGNNFVVYNRWLGGTNAIDYVTKDNLGSSAAMTDSRGALVVSETFAALGWNENTSAQEATMASITRHEFTGAEGLDNAGIWAVDMNGRVYQPSGARFYSPDPNIFDPENTQDYDRYSYVHNNPLTYVDPTGFDDALPTILVTGTSECSTLCSPSPTLVPDLIFRSSSGQPDAFLPERGDRPGDVAGNGGPRPAQPPSFTTPQIPCLPGVMCYVDQLQEVTVTATKIGTAIYDPPLQESSYGLEILGYFQNVVINAVCGDNKACRTTAIIVPLLVAPESAAGEEGLTDLATFRSELGLAAPSPGATTLARLDIGDESFYGISGHGQEITFDLNAVSASHAEADAFQQAINAGVSSPNATLYIDNLNGVCGYCLNSGLSSMMRASGVDSLTVISPRGTFVFGP